MYPLSKGRENLADDFHVLKHVQLLSFVCVYARTLDLHELEVHVQKLDCMPHTYITIGYLFLVPRLFFEDSGVLGGECF